MRDLSSETEHDRVPPVLKHTPHTWMEEEEEEEDGGGGGGGGKGGGGVVGY